MLTQSGLGHRGRSKQRQGVAAVEFAICVPILVVIVFGGTELNHLISLRHIASKVSHYAARDLILTDMSPDEIKQRYTQLADASGIRDLEITISPQDDQLAVVEAIVPLQRNASVTNIIPLSRFSISGTSYVYLNRDL